MKNVVVFTGAGISAESGIQTFRDSNGLWEGHDVMQVASPEGWKNNATLVLDFYNQRRINVLQAEPNAAHLALKKLEEHYHVEIITQNVDDLHERAGSSRVLHLHGEILKAQSTINPKLVYPLSKPTINLGETCELGSQLRPYIVWFGEAVPLMQSAIEKVREADIFIVIGTSLQVYPAAQLIHEPPLSCKCYLINNHIDNFSFKNYNIIHNTATEGVTKLIENLMK